MHLLLRLAPRGAVSCWVAMTCASTLWICWCQQIALVSQDTYLFNTSVRENLRLAR